MIKRFSFKYWLDCFFKARGHKYIKRVPSGTTKTGRIKYRYIYKVGHTHRGKHVDHHDDMVVNAKFMIYSKSGEEVHVHIKEVKENGDLVVVYDDGPRKGQEMTVTKKWLEGTLDYEHSVKSTLDTRKKKLEAQLKRMKESGKASAKQIARVQSELDRYKTEKEKKVRFDTPLKEGQEEFTSIAEKMDQLAKMEENLSPSGMVRNQKQYKELLEEVRKEVLEFKKKYELAGDSDSVLEPFLLGLSYKGNKASYVQYIHKQRERYLDKLKDYLERYDSINNPESSLKGAFLTPTERSEKVKDLHRLFNSVSKKARESDEHKEEWSEKRDSFVKRINSLNKNSLLPSRIENGLFQMLINELQELSEKYNKPSESSNAGEQNMKGDLRTLFENTLDTEEYPLPKIEEMQIEGGTLKLTLNPYGRKERVFPPTTFPETEEFHSASTATVQRVNNVKELLEKLAEDQGTGITFIKEPRRGRLGAPRYSTDPFQVEIPLKKKEDRQRPTKKEAKPKLSEREQAVQEQRRIIEETKKKKRKTKAGSSTSKKYQEIIDQAQAELDKLEG